MRPQIRFLWCDRSAEDRTPLHWLPRPATGIRPAARRAPTVDIFELSGPIRSLVAIAIAAVPAILTYMRGRRIARFADDPALPERLFASRRKASSTFVLTITALIIFTGTAAIWATPLMMIAYFAAGFP